MSYSDFANMSTFEVAFTIATAVLFTVVCYCIVPVILKFTLFKKKDFEKKDCKKIAILNSIAVFFIINIIKLVMNAYDGVSLAAPILYGFINYWILTHRSEKSNINKVDKLNEAINHTETNNMEYVPSYFVENDTSDLRHKNSYFDTDEDNRSNNRVDENPSAANNIEKIVKIEERDANNTISKKKFVSVTIALLGVCVLLAIATIFSMVALSEAKETIEIKDMKIERLESYERAALKYIDMAFIVVEGDNRYYHRIDCPSIGDNYRYRTFNSLQATNEGYSSCPVCSEGFYKEYIEENF